MGSKVMNDEFPDKEQRAAVCYRQFRKKGGEMKRENIIFVNRPVKLETVSAESGKETKTFITGVAIDEGTSRNKVYYSADVLEKATASLIGKPLLRDHNWEDVKSIIGKVTHAEFVEGEVIFRAEVDSAETDIIRKMEKGYVSSVSVGSLIDEDPFVDEQNIVHPSFIEFVELSVVTVPGVKNATISQVIHEKFSLKRDEEVCDMGEKTPDVDALKAENDRLKGKLSEIEAAEEAKKKQAKETEMMQRFEKIESAVKDVSESVKKIGEAKTKEGLVTPPAQNKETEFIWKDSENKEKGKMFFPKHPELLY